MPRGNLIDQIIFLDILESPSSIGDVLSACQNNTILTTTDNARSAVFSTHREYNCRELIVPGVVFFKLQYKCTYNPYAAFFRTLPRHNPSRHLFDPGDHCGMSQQRFSDNHYRYLLCHGILFYFSMKWFQIDHAVREKVTKYFRLSTTPFRIFFQEPEVCTPTTELYLILHFDIYFLLK